MDGRTDGRMDGQTDIETGLLEECQLIFLTAPLHVDY